MSKLWVSVFLISFSLMVSLMTSCGSDDDAGGSSPAASDAGSPAATYTYISKGLLARSCTTCHGTSGGVTLTSYENVLKVVTPKDPENSLLYTMVQSDAMPKEGAKLTDAEKTLIKDWITAGAENN